MSGKILVVGAGPAGLLVSLHIRSRDVVVLEEHREVGRPKHCAGFVSEETALAYASIAGWDVIDCKYNILIFHTPRGSYKLFFDKPLVYRLNRPLLEEKLLDKALSRGVEVELGKRVKPGASPGEVLLESSSKCFEAVVAADGAHSLFRKRYFRGYRERLIGIQYVYRARRVDRGVIHLFFNDLTPDFFQWLAPIDDDRVLAGFATRHYTVHPESIVKYIARRAGVELGSRVEVYGGLIPADRPLDKPVVANKVFLIGDSVPHVKPFTGGGLKLISLLAPILAASIDREDPALYVRAHRSLYSKLLIEHTATRLARRVGYWIPPVIVAQLYELGLLKASDYDEHYKLVFKALLAGPKALYTLLKHSE